MSDEERPSARDASDSLEINFTNIGKNIVSNFQLSRVAERFVKERQEKVPTLGIKQRGGQHSRSPNVPLCRTRSSIVQSLPKLTWNVLALKNMGSAHEQI